MPFGVTNAPATLCTLHNELFHPYLDDWWYTLIVGYSYSLNDHVSHLRTVFKVLKEESPLCKEREMLLWTDGDPIPRALDGHQSHRGVASTYQGEWAKIVFRARELLPKIHRKLLEEGCSTKKYPKEGRTDRSWHCTDRKSVKELLRT